ncbi:3-hydroxybutyrate dehydrogenase [Streptomyces sp. JV176]|uniref:3-hydroxybutyrate dehydrogenase n=1 Tax=Streptomyces sp. JV176 TaxID=858630 RepID=UPI002E79D08D|nr:3-hydroxybutyrate dehydrogenase [Streptomyces sp. JV176]MEE1802227.1 3-hydroxybutyrate dehydrogenase [Streptomyces sp. JV176]
MTAPTTPGSAPRTPGSRTADSPAARGPATADLAAAPRGLASLALDLEGRTALVTGAASGIGRACALRLAAAGARVRAVDRNGEELASLAREAEDAGAVGALDARVLDLTDLDAAGKAAEGADILVNSAGLQLVRPIEDFPPDVFHTVLTVMLEAPFRLIRGALPHMYAEGWGRIVNISSVHGLRASPYKSAYVAAKHGLEGLSKTAALEGASHGVTSNCVNPGYVRTPLVEKQIADQAQTHGIPEDRVVADVLLQDSALKRLLEPEEVAEAVAYLCTPQASFITGTSLTLDGGWTAH